jgi:hypothetical protein
MKGFFEKYKFHLLLLLIAILWIIALDFLMQGRSQTFISPDAQSYMDSAENLYVHWRGHNYRPMLMAAINGIPYLFGAPKAAILAFGFWVNLFCWLGSLVLLLEIAHHFLKPKTAFLLALPAVFLIGLNAIVFELATEHIYLFFVLLAFYFLARYYKTERFKFLCSGLALLVLMMLVKPGVKFFAILLTLVFIREIIFNYSSKFAWLIYGSYFLVLMQCAGVKYQFGNFTLGYIDAVTYYDYLGARAKALQTNQSFHEVWLDRVTYIYSRPCPEQKQIASADFLDQLQSNSTNLVKAYGLDLVENATTGSVQIVLMQNEKGMDYFKEVKILVYSISEWQNRLLSVLGFLLSVWAIRRFRNDQKPFAIIGGFVLYTILLSGVSCSEGDRFNVVTFPLVLILLAKFVVEKRKALSVV